MTSSLKELAKIGVYKTKIEALDAGRPRAALKSLFDFWLMGLGSEDEVVGAARLISKIDSSDFGIDERSSIYGALEACARRTGLWKYVNSASEMISFYSNIIDELPGMWFETRRIIKHFGGAVILRPTPEITDALKNTCLDVKLSDVQFPWPYFMMEWQDGTFSECISRLTVCCNKNEKLGMESKGLVCGVNIIRIAEDGGWREELIQFAMPWDIDITIAQYLSISNTIPGLEGLDDNDNKILREVVSVMLGAIMYASSESDHRVSFSRGLRGGVKPPKGESMVQVFDIGVEFGKLYRSAIKERRAYCEDRHSPIPHWRRGHFQMIPCGVGRSGRKLTWVRPTFVGCKDNEK